MAELLGVHPNSITKYQRQQGKPHAAVVRMFDLLCEKHSIRFEEFETGSATAAKGDKMKIVLAEKVSPATLAVFAARTWIGKFSRMISCRMVCRPRSQMLMHWWCAALCRSTMR